MFKQTQVFKVINITAYYFGIISSSQKVGVMLNFSSFSINNIFKYLL
ncbi:Putative uncharacterized protein [Moritella viscosa]|uniref:Uncharacterized protein n=1 Tax=Moritella viscosa TaxID=80854 RepID=A0ABY1HGS9_9GAMM|nr:Putative uncharacterized protein [Moritella viscosa]SGY95925.1 Putative uncharacterized protein [Moritella viscosa]SGZ01839.1 Putative uncharacterized protein [Moritella viscosa]SHO26313.1 Putative uncharacterized protein [Moritella viscosa]